jgi:hypothetical protein
MTLAVEALVARQAPAAPAQESLPKHFLNHTRGFVGAKAAVVALHLPGFGPSPVTLEF